MKLSLWLALAIFAALGTPSWADVTHETSQFVVVISGADCPQTGNLTIPVTIDETTRTVTDAQGRVHVGVDFRAQGTGSNENGQWTLLDRDTFSETGVPGDEIAVTEVFHLIGQGSTIDIFVRVIAHVGILSNGTVVVNFEHDHNLDAVGCTGTLPQ